MQSRVDSKQAFSLLELLMVMAVLSILLTGISMIFIETSRVARVQTQQAALQQNQRAVHQEIMRMTRMAGVGGLPITWVGDKSTLTPSATTVGSFPDGFAIGVGNNTGSGTQVGANYVLPGSDVLTIRGAFTTPVYYLKEPADLEGAVSGGEIEDFYVEVASQAGEMELPLTPLIEKVQEAIDDSIPMPFILRDLSNPDAYVIMEFDSATTNLTEYNCSQATTPAGWPSTSNQDGVTYCIRIGLQFKKTSGYIQSYGNLSMGTGLDVNSGSVQVDMPGGSTKTTLEIPKQVGSIGVLEEYKYYLKPGFQIPGDDTSRFSPILTRSELRPGTTVVLDEVEIARDIIDFQLAVGIDSNSTIGESGFNTITDDGSNNDEVLFNSSQDTLVSPAVLVSSGINPPAYYNHVLDFHFLRVTTVSQLAQATQGQWVPQLNTFEDHDLTQSKTVDGYTYNFNLERNVPRTYHQTIIELRNLR